MMKIELDCAPQQVAERATMNSFLNCYLRETGKHSYISLEAVREELMKGDGYNQ
jgi:hypothetical protein